MYHSGDISYNDLCIGRMMRGKTDDAWKLKILVPLVLGFLSGGIFAGSVYKGIALTFYPNNIIFLYF